MADIIRDAPVGQSIRYFTHNRFLKYPEEVEGWKCPKSYADDGSSPSEPTQQAATVRSIETPATEVTEDDLHLESEKTMTREKTSELDRELEKEDGAKAGLEKTETAHSSARTATDRTSHTLHSKATTHSQLGRVGSRIALENSHTRADLEQALSHALEMEKQPTLPILPEKLEDGTILVDWYTTDDPENPQAWSLGKKALVTFSVCAYTTAVYTGSAIVSAAEPQIMERFNVGPTAASSTLSLYVSAYGIGPLIFSPASEIPSIGRNPPYMITFAIYVILCVPTALVDNFAGLLVSRFSQGFFGSPCLATGGATSGDMYSFIKSPYSLTLWAFAACVGPAMGPIISGFSVSAENWRWSSWEMSWLSSPVWSAMFFLMPETNPSNILSRRAQRLRRSTGDQNLKAQSEIDQAKMKFKDIAIEASVRPIQLIVLDPAIAYVDIYISSCYAIYYSFFEAFPLVYIEMYGFNLGEMGLAFLSITVAVVIDVAFYYAYLYYIVEPEIRKNGLGAPERLLIPALFFSFSIPVGLFMFAWTSNPKIHWIASMIGVMLFTMGSFVLFQVIFVYLPSVYPVYAASSFAGNDASRSSLAAASILYARPLFINLGVGFGVSLSAASTSACIVGIYILFFYGDKLRARSKFAAK